MDKYDKTPITRQSGEYLPKVLRRIDYLHLDISEKRCDACQEWPEDHTWVVIDNPGQKVIFCDILAQRVEDNTKHLKPDS